MKTYHIVCATLVLACVPFGCAIANVEVDSACSSESTDLPGNILLSGFGKTVMQSFTHDLSDPLSKIDDFGTAALSSSSLVLTTTDRDFAFIKHVRLVAHAENKKDMLLSDMEFVNAAGLQSLTIPISANSDELLALLKVGPVTVDVSVTGNIPVAPTPVKATLCVGLSARVEKSL